MLGRFSNLSCQPFVGSDWPSPDLANRLITAYFTHINPLTPVLHSGVFWQDYCTARYLRDDRFARVCYTVFACAAICINDAEVLQPVDLVAEPGTIAHDTRHAAGWKYAQAAEAIGKGQLAIPTLEDLQHRAASPLCSSALSRADVTYIICRFSSSYCT